MGETEYDQQVKEGFSKLQKQVFESKQVIGMEEELQMVKEKQKQIASKVLAKMNNVDESRPVYRQVGRAYVLSSRNDEVKRMETIMSDCEAEVKKSEERKKYVMKCVEDAQNNLREMISTRK